MSRHDSYNTNVAFEKICVEHLISYFNSARKDNQLSIVLVNGEDQTMKDFQHDFGDAIMVDGKSNATRIIEFKCERRFTGNFFVETHSNLSSSHFKNGWFHHLKSHQIWYYFADTNRLLIADLPRLREWLLQADRNKVRLMSYQEVCQGTHEQKNRTVGRLVPILHIKNSLIGNKPILLKDVVLPNDIDIPEYLQAKGPAPGT